MTPVTPSKRNWVRTLLPPTEIYLNVEGGKLISTYSPAAGTGRVAKLVTEALE